MRFIISLLCAGFVAFPLAAQEDPAAPATEMLQQSTPEKDDPEARRTQQMQALQAADQLLDTCLQTKINPTARARLDNEIRQLYASTTDACNKNRRDRAVREIEKLRRDVRRKSDFLELDGCVGEFRTTVKHNEIPAEFIPPQKKFFLMLGTNEDIANYLCK